MRRWGGISTGADPPAQRQRRRSGATRRGTRPFGPKAKFGRTRAKIGPNLSRLRPKLAECEQHVPEAGPSLVRFGRFPSTVGSARAKFGRIRAEFCLLVRGWGHISHKHRRRLRCPRLQAQAQSQARALQYRRAPCAQLPQQIPFDRETSAAWRERDTSASTPKSARAMASSSNAAPLPAHADRCCGVSDPGSSS